MELSCAWLPCRMKNISYVGPNQISLWDWVCFETLSFRLSFIGRLPLALMNTEAAAVTESQGWSVPSVLLCGSAACDSLRSWVGRKTKGGGAHTTRTTDTSLAAHGTLLMKYWMKRHVRASAYSHRLSAVLYSPRPFHLFLYLLLLSFTSLSPLILSPVRVSSLLPFLSFPFLISPDSFFLLSCILSPLTHTFPLLLHLQQRMLLQNKWRANPWVKSPAFYSQSYFYRGLRPGLNSVCYLGGWNYRRLSAAHKTHQSSLAGCVHMCMCVLQCCAAVAVLLRRHTEDTA